jgi:prepilin-type N-terminal cleavage/methylation domain-containing protein
MSLRKRANKSFTLIEILVVIVVIGILSAFILVGMSSITNSANIAKSKTFANSLRNSLLTNLISEYKLEGNVNDSWGTKNGALNNFSANPWKDSSQCPSSQCLEFDGSDDYVSISNNFFGGLSSLTVEGWANGQQASNFFNTGVNILHFNGAGFYLTADDGTNSGYLAWEHGLNYNRWYHIAATWDGSVMKLYTNGICQNITKNFTGGTTRTLESAVNLHIGNYFNAGQPYFKGLIDDVRIYNQAIPTSEIQQNYYLGLNKLFKNNGITSIEYHQRIGELKNNLAKD